MEHDTLKLNGNGNSNEEGEEEEGESEAEEDDEEPSLKYERITGAVPDLLKKDSASALAVSNKLLVISSIHFLKISTLNDLFLLQALGTHAGIIQTPSRIGSRHITRRDSRLCRNCFY
jgi:hypothetical protein